MTPEVLTASPQRLTGRFTPHKSQGEPEALRVVTKPKAVSFRRGNASLVDGPSTEERDSDVEFVVPILPKRFRTVDATPSEDAAVLQIWEGTVIEVDVERQVMKASLHAKHGRVEDHVGDVHFEWVMDQDRTLMKPGGVFYLTLYKNRKPGGTKVNSQELRFRRLPAWTRTQVAEVESKAAALLEKMRPRPLAE